MKVAQLRGKVAQFCAIVAQLFGYDLKFLKTAQKSLISARKFIMRNAFKLIQVALNF